MSIQNCHNCEQIIGNLQEPFSFQGHIVCKACKILLEEESQIIGAVDSDTETEIPIAETLPQVDTDTEHESTAGLLQQEKQENKYGGIRRTGYFLGILGISILIIVANATAVAANDPIIASSGLLISLVPLFILVVNRLHNIGTSGWWSLLIIVPFGNIFVGVTCAIYPEGYKDTKKLDTAGKIMAGILIVLAVVAFVFGTISMLGYYHGVK